MPSPIRHTNEGKINTDTYISTRHATQQHLDSRLDIMMLQFCISMSKRAGLRLGPISSEGLVSDAQDTKTKRETMEVSAWRGHAAIPHRRIWSRIASLDVSPAAGGDDGGTLLRTLLTTCESLHSLYFKWRFLRVIQCVYVR